MMDPNPAPIMSRGANTPPEVPEPRAMTQITSFTSSKPSATDSRR